VAWVQQSDIPRLGLLEFVSRRGAVGWASRRRLVEHRACDRRTPRYELEL